MEVTASASMEDWAVTKASVVAVSSKSEPLRELPTAASRLSLSAAPVVRGPWRAARRSWRVKVRAASMSPAMSA